MPREELYCEMCGARIVGRPYRAVVDGVEMVLCARCYESLVRSGRAQPLPSRPRIVTSAPPRTPSRPGARAPQPRGGGARRVQRRRVSLELYDLVEDYGERIRRAREAKGWSLQALAQRLRISESLLRKIEQEKVKPPIDLARRIEKVLRIKILVPSEIEEEYEAPPPGTLTLGDVVVIRRDED